MPRKGYKAPTREKKLRVQIENAINEARKYSDMNDAELCAALGMCRTTLWTRLKDPDKFTLGELRVLAMLSGCEYSAFLEKIVK